MYDVNGKTLNVNDIAFTYMHGVIRILKCNEEHDEDKGGALIEVVKMREGVWVNDEPFEIRTHEYKVTKVRTWEELADEAIFIQDATNLVSIAGAFGRAAQDVSRRLDSEGKGGMSAIWQHPVCVLFSSKLASLTSSESATIFSNAYNWAKDLTEKKG